MLISSFYCFDFYKSYRNFFMETSGSFSTWKDLTRIWKIYENSIPLSSTHFCWHVEKGFHEFWFLEKLFQMAMLWRSEGFLEHFYLFYFFKLWCCYKRLRFMKNFEALVERCSKSQDIEVSFIIKGNTFSKLASFTSLLLHLLGWLWSLVA